MTPGFQHFTYRRCVFIYGNQSRAGKGKGDKGDSEGVSNGHYIA
jgi:hypothetical protein